MNILINRGNIQNTKSYPFWDEVISLLEGNEIKEIKGILFEQEIIDLVNWCDVWISIDSFIQHLVAYHKLKRGIVLWGKSDPLLFGCKENINLLKDRKYLRKNQFRDWVSPWNDIENIVDMWITPQEVVKKVKEMV